jgi:hypothetical protein
VPHARLTISLLPSQARCPEDWRFILIVNHRDSILPSPSEIAIEICLPPGLRYSAIFGISKAETNPDFFTTTVLKGYGQLRAAEVGLIAAGKCKTGTGPLLSMRFFDLVLSPKGNICPRAFAHSPITLMMTRLRRRPSNSA